MTPGTRVEIVPLFGGLWASGRSHIERGDRGTIVEREDRKPSPGFFLVKLDADGETHSLNRDILRPMHPLKLLAEAADV